MNRSVSEGVHLFVHHVVWEASLRLACSLNSILDSLAVKLRSLTLKILLGMVGSTVSMLSMEMFIVEI